MGTWLIKSSRQGCPSVAARQQAGVAISLP